MGFETYEYAIAAPDESAYQAIRIHTLGRFAVLKDDGALSFTGKTQRKPMSLLKAVLAFGGTEASSQELINMLWPEAEGDAARNAFDVALHRLRKLMSCDSAVILREGRVSLNPRVCWTDIWEFERVARSLETAARDCDPCVEQLVERMLKLYRGPFCSSDSEVWMLGYRERFRMKFQRLACLAGRCLEHAGRFDQAAEIYQRAVELDPLAEQFYRGLMICRRRSGHIAEALDVYRRCRDILSITLSVQPSEDTQAVYRLLLQPRASLPR